MSGALLLGFDNFPRQRIHIGDMLLAYGELEIAMVGVLASVVGTAKSAVRTLYQLRSESQRIDVFEAVAEPWFEQAGLIGHFHEAIAAINHCKKIRNQYAHCIFIEDGGILKFAELETVAKRRTGASVVAKPLTLALVEQQRDYFNYAEHMLFWLAQEYCLKTGQPTVSGRAAVRTILKPRRIQPPKLNSLGEKHARQSTG